jgi:hypothetical protein
MAATVHIHEVIGIVGLTVCLSVFVIRPWFRQRRVTLHGMIALALLTMYWQEMLANYFNHVYTYNSELINRGSWYGFIPGWSSPHGNRLVEPLLFSFPMFVVAFLPPCLFFAYLLRRAKRRWPTLGIVGLLLIGLGLAAVFDLVLEMVWVRLGVYAFAGTIPALTIFQDRYYQFPLYQPFLMGAVFMGYTALLYFRDDRGNTVAERGVDAIRVTRRQASWLRFLALSGFVNLVLIGYQIAFIVVSLLPSFRWAQDIVDNRSYLRDQVCGSGTTYACPSEDVPVPRRGGLHVDPNGELVVPAGAKLPGG